MCNLAKPAIASYADHAILNNEYDDIFAQQRLAEQWNLSRRTTLPGGGNRGVPANRRPRIDCVFAHWNGDGQVCRRHLSRLHGLRFLWLSSLSYGSRRAPVRMHFPFPHPKPRRHPEASLVRQGSAAGVALPHPFASPPLQPTSVPRFLASESRSRPDCTALVGSCSSRLHSGASFSAETRRSSQCRITK